MGIQFDKLNVSRSSMICPTDYENWTEVGSVYLVVHKSHDDQTCGIEKRKHFSLATDITAPGRTCLTRSYRILTKSDEILGTGIQSEVVGHRKMLEYSRSDRNYN